MLMHPPEYNGSNPAVAVKRPPYSGQYAAHRNGLYLAALKAAADPTSELFHRDSRTGLLYQRSGASHRCAFWAGYKEAKTGIRNKLAAGHPLSDAAVMYRAGKDFGKADIVRAVPA